MARQTFRRVIELEFTYTDEWPRPKGASAWDEMAAYTPAELADHIREQSIESWLRELHDYTLVRDEISYDNKER